MSAALSAAAPGRHTVSCRWDSAYVFGTVMSQRFFSKMSVNILDIGAGAKLELVDNLCYMLSVDGDVDAAVETGIRIGWNKFRQLVPLLISKEVSLIMRGRL